MEIESMPPICQPPACLLFSNNCDITNTDGTSGRKIRPSNFALFLRCMWANDRQRWGMTGCQVIDTSAIPFVPVAQSPFKSQLLYH